MGLSTGNRKARSPSREGRGQSVGGAETSAVWLPVIVCICLALGTELISGEAQLE